MNPTKTIVLLSVLLLVSIAGPVRSEHEQEDACDRYAERFYQVRQAYEKQFQHHERDVLAPLRRQVHDARRRLGKFKDAADRMTRLRTQLQAREKTNDAKQRSIDRAQAKNDTDAREAEAALVESAALSEQAAQAADEKQASALRRKAKGQQGKASNRRRNIRERDGRIAAWNRKIARSTQLNQADQAEINRIERELGGENRTRQMRELQGLQDKLQKQIDVAADAHEDVDQAEQTYEMCRSLGQLERENRELRDENRRLHRELDDLRRRVGP
jgi:chromosome segregation ATPase